MISSRVCAALIILTAFPGCVLSADQHSQPVIIELQRETRALQDHAGLKNFYSAVVQVGSPEPQQMRVAFDMTGATTTLTSKECRSKACSKHRAYDKWLSDSAEDVQRDGSLVMPGTPKVPSRRKRFLARDVGSLNFVSVEFGEGRAKGKFVRDTVCFDDKDGKARCLPLAFLAATTMTDEPFHAEPYDGVIGLGLDGDALSRDFYFLSQFGLTGTGETHPIFGLYMGSKQGAELALGGYDRKRIDSPISWAPLLDTDDGRWQVSISAIRVGNRTLDMCNAGKCRAALDHSTSLFSVPSSYGATFESALSLATSPKSCDGAAMPELQLVIGTLTLSVPVWDHAFSSPLSVGCTPALATHDLAKNTPADAELMILGESVLQRYYTIYDTDARRIGFSLAAAAPGSSTVELLGEDDKTEATSPVKDQSGVILLVQVKITRSKTQSSLGV